MAAQLPEGSFLGIDQSERQVAEGRATIAAAGLKNVEIKQLDVLDTGSDLGNFDYIICYGVFSWVPPEVQQKILSLIVATLAPDGVAPDPLKAALRQVSDDPVRQKGYLDLIRGRTFRRTLLCHEGVSLLPGPSAAAVEGLHAAMPLVSGSLSPELSAGANGTLRTRDNRDITLDDPVQKATVLTMAEQWPRAIPFRDVWSAAVLRVSRAGLPTSNIGEPERRRLAAFMLQGYSARGVAVNPLPRLRVFLLLNAAPAPISRATVIHGARWMMLSSHQGSLH